MVLLEAIFAVKKANGQRIVVLATIFRPSPIKETLPPLL
ncbi:hypothetical protein L580_0883 [Serratia fonticola AU-P3(3)]|nr:hypothetical protein L580_0883 [Serratia fonticola AU-P3(3)]